MTGRYLERVEFLRARALDPFISYHEFYLHFYRRYSENFGSRRARIADAWAFAFDNTCPVIDDGEVIVGNPGRALTDAEQAEWNVLYEGIGKELRAEWGQDSHMAINYESVLSLGIRGIIGKIDSLIEGADAEKQEFYACCKMVLEAVVRFSKKYAAHAKSLAEKCADDERKAELYEIAAACENVPENPARSFYEAVQAAHFISLCLSYSPQRPGAMQQFQLGHPDRYLLPYYNEETLSGSLSKERAQFLFDCLAIQINRRVPHGLSSGYMLGGRDRKGEIVQNDLTMMGMQVIDDIRLVYPSVGLCWTRGMEEKYMEKACNVLSHGRSHPAIFNDDIITQGLLEYGVDEEDAHEYIHSTCVEITPVSASNVWVASPYTNMLGLLIDIMDREYADFDSLMAALFAHLDDHIAENFDEQNRYRALRKDVGFHPLLSCFVRDCLANGVDMEQGGAKYNWIMPSFVGMANLVDSLHVLKKAVFEEKALSIAEIKAAMDKNFEGCEPLRLRLMNRYPKYGNDISEVDSLFTVIIDHIVAKCREFTPMLPNARLIPSVFCWVMHERFGRETGASPDGRLAGFPLGDGSGPCQGREKMGPTASILSSTRWSHKELIGGVAVNMKFTKKTFNEASGVKVRALIHAFLERGGFEMQINVVDKETLLKAQADPETYRDLVVRIGGYSDYFVKISPEMQAEVILRTEHEA